MKKIIRNFLYGLVYLFIVFILSLIFLKSVKAEIIKPNSSIEPYQVIKIVLRGLKNNDKPKIDNGIKQTWEFAHPNNQRYTGPLEQFINMLKGQSYSVLLNHLEHKILEIQLTDTVALYEITILDGNKTYYKFNWQVQKYIKDGPLKDCWLTTVVSAPIVSGSSI